MRKFDLKMITRLSVVAAIYVVATVAFAPLSYGGIQFRLSEILVLLVLYKKEYSISLILGCFIANLFSPLGWPDIIFGTLATTISVFIMMMIKNKFVSSLVPAVINGFIVGLELHILFDLPLFLTIAQVAIGEFVVITLIGLSVFKSMEGNEGFNRLIGDKNLSENKPLNDILQKSLISFGLFVLFTVLYFTFPIFKTGVGDNATNFSLYNLSFQSTLYEKHAFLILLLIIPFLGLLVFTFLDFSKNVVINIFLTLGMISILISANVIYFKNGIDANYYIYYLVTVLPLILQIYLHFKKKKTINI